MTKWISAEHESGGEPAIRQAVVDAQQRKSQHFNTPSSAATLHSMQSLLEFRTWVGFHSISIMPFNIIANIFFLYWNRFIIDIIWRNSSVCALTGSHYSNCSSILTNLINAFMLDSISALMRPKEPKREQYFYKYYFCDIIKWYEEIKIYEMVCL